MDTKTALLSVLVNRLLLTENEGPTCQYSGTTFADMGQLLPTRGNLPRHGATYPDMGQLTTTWGKLPRHGAGWSQCH